MVKVADVTLDPNRLDPGHDFVFRDFERSKIQLIRSILHQDRGLYALVYLVVVVFWTTMMSYAAATHDGGGFAVNMAPHIAHYTLIIGVMLYPLRRMWIPLAAFSLVYLIPFVIPDSMGAIWLQMSSINLQLVGMGFALHVISGVAIGKTTLHLARKLQSRFGPYSVDLFSMIAMFFAFMMIGAIQTWLFWLYAQSLPISNRLELGYGPYFVHAAIERVMRGGVVATGFLLAVLEVPSRKVFLQSLALAPVFPLLAVAQAQGWVMYGALDACFLALFVVITLPAAVGIGACIVGIPIYSAMTGGFVSLAHLYDPAQDKLEHYSIIALVLIVLVPTLRAYTQHSLRQREGSMRRLSMVRDFANVGLLSFNLDRRRFRTDGSAQRLLGTSAEGNAAQFESLFAGSDQRHLNRALRAGQYGSVNLLLARQPVGKLPQVLRMCLWYETAPSGEQVAYGLVLDVTAEHHQERALKETLAELSSRQERQRQLFSIISHELRTPASVVSMLVEDLDETQVTATVRKQLRDATDQLLTTLADMRQTVNPSQNLPINRQPFAAIDLAESVRNMFAPQAKEHGMAIHLNLGDSSRLLRIGDQMRVRQALSNVVRNAIIHSKGSVVTLRFEEAGVNLSRWTITDNGIGIPAHEVGRLFKPFERGIQDPRSKADGSGLGLFIAKSSVEMLGGTITHFAPEMGGTGYRIDLPEPLAGDLATVAVDDAMAYETATFPDFFIVLAEDNALVADVTLAKLSRFVGRVQLVANGREALEVIDSQRPDLLITDLFMPEMDGDDLIRALRARRNSLPIVGLTAAVVGDDIDRLRAAGADEVMSKPLEMRVLRKFIYDLTQRPTRGAA